AGPLTYASGMWEPVDWGPFDIAATDAYCDAGNAGTFRSKLRKQLRHGKPLAVTEFGCCGYAGAAARGGMGWAIIDDSTDPPRLDGDYVRDESEQVRYLEELNAIFAEEGVDLAFWFTFAGYSLVHDADPRRDLDMASYGVVQMLPGGPGTGYDGLGWEPKLAFGALARADWQAAPVQGGRPPWPPARCAGRPHGECCAAARGSGAGARGWPVGGGGPPLLAEPLESVEEDVQRELEGFKPAPGGAGSRPAADLGTALAAVKRAPPRRPILPLA